ncbi:MAG: type II CRISPR-associated endonuclease Cas1 [Bacteroidales bacterium]
MIKKTLYFGNPAYLSLKNNQLTIDQKEQEKTIRTIPIEDIGIVLLDHPQITLTHNLIEALLENNSALITCDRKHLPVGLLLPLEGNTLQNERFRHQIEASLPLQKQLWQQTVQYKITNQCTLLEKTCNAQTGNMKKWIQDVRSGDPDNLEARAAAYYWKNIFTEYPGFTRDKEGDYPNNMLNYGYAILRGTIARALVVSGLLPTLGIHHRNKYNAYCLADDVMEPYRPFVDKLVLEIVDKEQEENILTTSQKIELLKIPTLDVVINGQKSPLMIAAGMTTASLAKCFLGETRKILYPTL